MEYLDVDLEIGAGLGRDYPVVVRSKVGEARLTMRFPYDEVVLESRLKDLRIALLQSLQPLRKAISNEERAIQDFGRTLFDALLAGEARTLYDVSRDRAAQEGRPGVRLRMRIQAPELAALPWEYLFDSRQDDYICLSRSTPLVRYSELASPIQPLAITPPLHILGMIASPSDMDSLEVEREQGRMHQALAKLEAEGLVQLTWLAGQTWEDLQEAMWGGPWHVFHFIGHGGFDQRSEEGMLAFSNEQGKAHLLSATHLARLLTNHRTLRLVILNACEGGKGSSRDLFSSTAATLARRGIPAVLAMQEQITDRASIQLTRTFYRALSKGLPVEAAVAEARTAISLSASRTLEWGTPILYLRSTDGVLFTMGERTSRLEQKSLGETAAQDGSLDHLDTDTLPDGIGDGKVTGPHSTRQEKQWDEATFFADLERRRGRAEADVARKILDWAKRNHLRIWWGKGLQDGSFFPMLDHGSTSHWTVAVWTYGRVEIQFQWMVNKPPFDQVAKRLELLRRFNQLPGVGIPASAITKRPSIALAVLREDAALSLFLQTLEWVVQEATSVAGDANSTSVHMDPEPMTSSPPEEPNMKYPTLVRSPGQMRETGTRKFWLMRAGDYGEAKEMFLQESVIAMDWRVGDQRAFPTDARSFTRAFLARYRQDHPEEDNERSLAQYAGTNYRFVHQMASGDGVVLVPKKALDPRLYLGQIEGDYYFQSTPPPALSDFTHQRKVQWKASGLRSEFSAAFIHMVEHYLGTLCQIDEQYYAELSSRLQHQGE